MRKLIVVSLWSVHEFVHQDEGNAKRQNFDQNAHQHEEGPNELQDCPPPGADPAPLAPIQVGLSTDSREIQQSHRKLDSFADAVRSIKKRSIDKFSRAIGRPRHKGGVIYRALLNM
jgi:hypothetical protein